MKKANELSLREMKEIKGGDGLKHQHYSFAVECDPQHPSYPRHPDGTPCVEPDPEGPWI